MILKEAVQLGVRELSFLPKREAQAKLRRLFSHILGREYSTLPLLGSYELSYEDEQKFFAILERLKTHEPIEYILEEAWFYSYPFSVSPATLIPRPETEELVELILTHLEGNHTIVDCGTGSGAIALTIASEVLNSEVEGIRKIGKELHRVYALDVSEDALQICAQNVEDLELSTIATPLHMDATSAAFGDFLQSLKEPLCIVANFPYIPTREMASLAPTVRQFEPHLALDGGPDGTSLIIPLLQQCERHATAICHIFLEIDPANQPPLEAYLKTSPFQASFLKDLSDTVRFVHITPRSA